MGTPSVGHLMCVSTRGCPHRALPTLLPRIHAIMCVLLLSWLLRLASNQRQWTLNAAEHTPSTFAAAATVPRVIRRLSDAEVMVLKSALGADAFWQLPRDEPRLTPEQDPIGYHGPSWFLEGRSGCRI